MITIECDACSKTFEVDSKEAGGRVPCPHCGDVNRVPAEDDTHDAEVGSRGDGSSGAEKQIVIIRPAMFRAHPFRFTLLLAIFAGGAALVITALASMIAMWLAIPGGILLGVAIVWYLLWWLNTHLWIKAIVTNKRTIRQEGIIRRHTTEVLHDHVRSVNINQNFIQRILNVGYIGIDSAGQEDIEIQIRDIPAPYRMKEIIDRYRRM